MNQRIKSLIDLGNKISKSPTTSDNKVKLEDLCSKIANIESEEIYDKIVSNFQS